MADQERTILTTADFVPSFDIDDEGYVTGARARSAPRPSPTFARLPTSPVDPRFREYTSTNLSENVPGATTALTATVCRDILTRAPKGIADLFGFSGPVQDEVTHRGPVPFGHRLDANISATRRMAETVPGMNSEGMSIGSNWASACPMIGRG